jgi:hypothetical protein
MSKSKVAGWVLSLILALILIVPSAGGKFTYWDGKSEMFGKLGWSEDVMYIIGIVEVLVAVLFLIPHTAFVGAILVTAYLGGAVATHVRISDSSYFPIVLGVVAWLALGLRDPRVFELAFCRPGKGREK